MHNRLVRPPQLRRRGVLSAAWSVVVVVAATLGTALPAGTAGASTTATSVASMTSEPGDWVGQGLTYAYVPGRSSITAATAHSRQLVSLTVSQPGTTAATFVLMFAAAPGQQLAERSYVNVDRADEPTKGHPGLYISGDGRGCSGITGNFRVRDIAWRASGQLKRFSATFVQHCEGRYEALFGEVRFSEPSTDTLLTVPSHLDFPSAYPGVAQLAGVTMQNRSDSPMTVLTEKISGHNSSDFSLTGANCSGQTLPPGGICHTVVQFKPTATLERAATLQIASSSGRPIVVPLTGAGITGVTNFTYHSDPGDPIGGGQSATLTPVSAQFYLLGNAQHLQARMYLYGDGSLWLIDLAPPAGGRLRAGTYSGAVRYPNNGGHPGISVQGRGFACNSSQGSFTIHDVSYDPKTGTPEKLSVSVTQHCDGAAPALHGTFNYGE